MVQVEFDSEANEYIATMDGFWFVEAGNTADVALIKLAEQLIDYSFDYIQDAERYMNAPNTKKQFSRIIKALVIGM